MLLKKSNGLFLLLAIIGVITLIAITTTPKEAGAEVIVYKSPTCGCCVNYIGLLKRANYQVKVIEMDNLSIIKQQYGISADLESCHTAVFDNYVVEGHVPFEAIEKLLTERPDIHGIALPGMPAGSPGMPGIQRAPFTIYALSDNDRSIYLQK